MPCISEQPVNGNNFLRWHHATDLYLPFVGALAYCTNVRPGFTYDPVAESEVYGLPVVNGDTIKFAINNPVGMFPDGIADLRLGLIQNGGLVAPNTGTLQAMPVVGGYLIYGDLFINNLADQLYWPCVYQESDKKVLLVANPVHGVSRRAWMRDTVVVQYKHHSNVFEYPYGDLPGFYNQFRLDAILHNYQPVMELTTYRDMNKQPHVSTDLLARHFTLETDFVDLETHYAMVAMLVCETLTISNNRTEKAYKPTNGYEHTPPEIDFNLTTGRVKLEDIEYTRALSMCKQ